MIEVQMLNQLINTSEFRSVAQRGQRVNGIDQRQGITRSRQLTDVLLLLRPFGLPAPSIVTRRKTENVH